MGCRKSTYHKIYLVLAAILAVVVFIGFVVLCAQRVQAETQVRLVSFVERFVVVHVTTMFVGWWAALWLC
jgi:flagellar biosynthesis protein FliQ